VKQGHPLPPKGGIEEDAFTRWRNWLGWGQGTLKWTKRKYWKRVRRTQKQEDRNEVETEV
jgi:hypothetical protein